MKAPGDSEVPLEPFLLDAPFLSPVLLGECELV